MKARTISLLLISLAAGAVRAEGTSLAPLLPDAVRAHAETALSAWRMTPDDAGFAKDHGEPLWTLGWVTNVLNDPWLLPPMGDRIAATAQRDEPAAWWSLMAEHMELASAPSNQPESFANTPGIEEALALFTNRVAEADRLLTAAYAPIAPASRIAVAASVLAPMLDLENEPERREAFRRAGFTEEALAHVEAESRLLDMTEPSRAWLAEIGRIDYPHLLAAAALFQSAVDGLADWAAAWTNWPSEVQRRATPWGELVIGTTGDDRHERASLLILDPGGDDRYRDEAGAANGLVGASLAAIVDVGGNDTYTAEGLLAPGSALWGVAVVHDAAGDDRHDAEWIGVASAVFGSAWVDDRGGDDTYRAHVMSQGAATAGWALLRDQAGDDRYEVGAYGQGFSGVRGWGLLFDRGGHDVYLAGNRIQDFERDEPRFFSFAQGFSIGMRPHAGGGVAALVDLAGNDTYLGDIYAQGVSYYYAAGFLLDGAGNDRYDLHQYGQGCGIHLSLGLLADADGQDTYTGAILAQGAAHDYAVGMLFDHAGHDQYTADHHAQGRALNNAFALLVDRAGDDRYFGRDRQGTQGIGNEGGFRDYGSLALLVDLAGDDTYSGGFSNRAVTLRPLYGVVYDE